MERFEKKRAKDGCVLIRGKEGIGRNEVKVMPWGKTRKPFGSTVLFFSRHKSVGVATRVISEQKLDCLWVVTLTVL